MDCRHRVPVQLKNKKYTMKIHTLYMLLFATAVHAQPVPVAESTLKVGAMAEEVFYYGFAEGDQLVFSFREVKGKELKELEISEVGGSSLFMDYKTEKIEKKTLPITRTGIYRFRFANSALAGRVCSFSIQRIPVSEAQRNFNTSVYWRTVYDTTYATVPERFLIRREFKPVEVLAMSEHYVNSGSNATLKGGKSRVTIPVILPPNTQEWYYVFSASREKADVDKVAGTFSLMKQLTSLVDQTQLLSVGVGMLSSPPGGNICDVYLLDFSNSQLFEAKVAYSYFKDGSRENIKSGIIKMPGGAGQTYYIGIKNPDSMYGIQVAVEAVAIVLEEEWGIRDVKKANVIAQNIPYLQN